MLIFVKIILIFSLFYTIKGPDWLPNGLDMWRFLGWSFGRFRVTRPNLSRPKYSAGKTLIMTIVDQQ